LVGESSFYAPAIGQLCVGQPEQYVSVALLVCSAPAREVFTPQGRDCALEVFGITICHDFQPMYFYRLLAVVSPAA
jgi:hypothetical protein